MITFASSKKLVVRLGLVGLVVVVGWGFYALFFRPAAPTPPQCLIQSVGKVQALALSPDGKTLADAGEFDRVTLYDAVTGKEGRILPVNSDWVLFSRDGRRLMTVGEGRFVPKGAPPAPVPQIVVWDAATGRRISAIDAPLGIFNLQAVSADLSLALISKGFPLSTRGLSESVYSLVTGKPLKTFPASSGLWNSAFSPDGSLLAVGNDTGLGNLRLWDTRTWQPVHALDGQALGCARVRFSPDGTLLAGLTKTGLSWWDTRTWQKRGGVSLMAPASRFAQRPYPRFSSDSRHLAMTEVKQPPKPGLWYNIVKLWNPNIYQEQQIIRIWDCGAGRETATLPNQTLERMSYGNNRMLTQVTPQVFHQGDPRRFLLWDAGRGRVVSRFQIDPDPDDEQNESDYVSDLSDDGNVAVLGGRNFGMIRLWRTPAH